MQDSSQVLAEGMRHRRRGDLRRAEAACRRVLAIQSDDADALHLLGLLACDAGNYDTAAALIVQAIRVHGPRPAFCANLGAVLAGQGKTAQSIACYRQAAALAPSNSDIRYNLAAALAKNGQIGDAMGAYTEALRLNPGNVEAWNNLGNLLQKTGSFEDAAGCYQAALARSSGNPETVYNLGLCLQNMDRLEEAEQSYRAAIQLKPDLADAHNNLGNVLRERGRPRDAIAAYQKALRLNPGHADAPVNLGIAHLLLGEFDQGWREYARRFGGDQERYSAGAWDGASLAGRRILLYSEQGFGDTIQFIRYASLVRDRGGVVFAEVQPQLVDLLRTVHGIDGGLLVAGASRRIFDCHASLLSLPRLFETTLETIPANVPYVAADPTLAAEWARELSAPAGRRKIGVAWAGNPGHANDRNRSLPPAMLSALGDVPGAAFFSLQQGPRAADAEVLNGAFRLRPLTRELRDFADTAAAIVNLDLVISVDTAVAHLAGALGKPVWVLLPFAPDWRWMLNRDDSPWYPTMRLFRQPRRGDWESVLAAVRKELSSPPSATAA